MYCLWAGKKLFSVHGKTGGIRSKDDARLVRNWLFGAGSGRAIYAHGFEQHFSNAGFIG